MLSEMGVRTAKVLTIVLLAASWVYTLLILTRNFRFLTIPVVATALTIWFGRKMSTAVRADNPVREEQMADLSLQDQQRLQQAREGFVKWVQAAFAGMMFSVNIGDTNYILGNWGDGGLTAAIVVGGGFVALLVMSSVMELARLSASIRGDRLK